MISRGYTNQEIGERLGITPRTVRAHSDALRVALGVTHRRHIPRALQEQGYATGWPP
jgi:DNA-binding NarL/FixJ family response regulator